MELINKELVRLNDYLTKSANANTFLDVFSSKEDSIAKINSDDPIVARKIVTIEIIKLNNLLNAELNDVQIEKIVNNIIVDFWHLKIADFNLIATRLSYVKQYGKPQIGDIMSEIVQYNIERMERGETIGDIKVKQDEAEIKSINDNIRKTYDAIRSRPPEPTQKEKDAEKRAINEEKFKEIERLFPDDKYDRLLKNM